MLSSLLNSFYAHYSHYRVTIIVDYSSQSVLATTGSSPKRVARHLVWSKKGSWIWPILQLATLFVRSLNAMGLFMLYAHLIGTIPVTVRPTSPISTIAQDALRLLADQMKQPAHGNVSDKYLYIFVKLFINYTNTHYIVTVLIKINVCTYLYIYTCMLPQEPRFEWLVPPSKMSPRLKGLTEVTH